MGAGPRNLTCLWVLGLSGVVLLPLGGCKETTLSKANKVSAADSPWTVSRSWNAEAENEFSQWIAHLGEAREKGVCRTFAGCIANPKANTLFAENDSNFSSTADCADVVMGVRAYFAYRTHRPFLFVSKLEADPLPDGTQPKDLRYSKGNKPVGFYTHRTYENLSGVLKFVVEHVHSGFFRMSPEVEGTDTFPINVSPQTVRPGTLFHIPNGHVAVIYKVSPDGTVSVFDGHPDNSFTIGRSIDKFFAEKGIAWHRGEYGGGFRTYRWPVPDGKGQLRWETNNEASSRGYSTAQYRSSSEYDIGGVSGTYQDWVRYRLSGGRKMNPVTKFVEQVESICDEAKNRVDSIDKAIEAKIPDEQHPGIPENIYSSQGPWESFSTPSRDIRFRSNFEALFNYVQSSYDSVKKNEGRYSYQGSASDLAKEYKKLWIEKASACTISYKNSIGKSVTVNLRQIMTRIYDLAFDPYLCPEMRWGAYPARAGKEAHSEYATCKADPAKEAMYWREEAMRAVLDRNQTVPDTGTDGGAGSVSKQDINVSKLLERLQ